MKGINKIGIFGGTFDPIHLGHVGCAKSAANELNLDKVFFVPTGISNFKQDQKTASRKHRIEMCRLAIDGNKKFALDTFDAEHDGVSYTVDTVKHFHDIFPKAKLYFITGSDAALTFDKWYKYRKILDFVTLVVVTRKGSPVEDNSLQHLQQVCDNNLIIIEADVVDISSHELREKIYLMNDNAASVDGANKSEIFNYLDKKVLDYMKENSLYL